MGYFHRPRYSLLFFFLFIGIVTLSGQNESAPQQLVFVENKGQIIDMNNNVRPDILFTAENNGAKIFMRRTGFSIVMLFEKNESQKDNIQQLISGNSKNKDENIKGHRLDLDFENCNTGIEVVKEKRTQGYFNYYLGHCAEGITNVNAYEKIIYKNVYSNIDVIFYGAKNAGIKYDIVVHPGGDPGKIKIKYTGAERIWIENQSLKISCAVGKITETMPKVYQNINGEIKDVAAAYLLDRDILSFAVNNYQPNSPLIIDPWITYYGGTLRESSGSIATNTSGDAYVTGSTVSLNFPVIPGAFQLAYAGGAGNDIFISKFNSAGVPQWSTYYGGTAEELGLGITTDNNGDIAITGYTASSNFPLSVGAWQTNFNLGGLGDADAILIKLNATGARLWATYYGGDGALPKFGVDYGHAVIADANNNLILTGYTVSSTFPTSAGAYQTVFGGVADIIMVKFDANGNMIWSTYYGGNDHDQGNGINCDALNNLVLAGQTASTNYPYTAGAFQTSLNGTTDACVIKFTSAGMPVWSTYIGGSVSDYSNCIDIDALGNVVVGGATYSTDFPVSTGAYQTAFGGPIEDAFITKFTSAGAMIWSTYLGGSNREESYGLAIDGSDNIIICGDTYSADFPVTSCAYQTQAGGDEDIFLARFDSSGSILCSGYICGPAHDELDDVTVGGPGAHLALYQNFIYITGTTPGQYPVTPGAYQTNFGGGTHDAFVAKLCAITCGLDTFSTVLAANQTIICMNDTVNFSSFTSLCDTSNAEWQWTFSGATPSVSTLQNPSGIIYPNSGSYTVKLVITTPCGADSVIHSNYINVSAAVAAIGGASSVCEGESVTLSASGGTSYLWNTGATTATILISPTLATTYSVTVISGSCSDTASVVVNVNQRPAAIVSNDTSVCSGQSVTLTASGGTSYSWNNSPTTASIIVTPTGNTTYSVVVSDGSCSDTAVVNVTINALPVIAVLGTLTICSGDSTTLTASGGSSYLWNTGSSAAQLVVKPTANSIYSLTVSNGICSDTTSVLVNVAQPPVAMASNDTAVCIGQNITLTASGGTAYTWNTGASSSSVFITPLNSGIYTVTVSNNPCYDIEGINVVVNQPPIATVVIVQGVSTSLSASGGISYSWSPAGGLSCITCSSPTANNTQTTIYCVVVTDINNCTDTACILVTKDTACGRIFVPNAFSPNGDGQNDFLQLYYSCIKTIMFRIYDRWGEIIFETNDPSQKWDGSCNGKQMNTGVFVYSLNAVFADDEEIIKHGNITLIR